MNSTGYTLVYKQHYCKMWKINLTLTVKYRFFDDEQHIAKYASCSCPVIENLKKPHSKQDKKYELFRYCKMHEECLSSMNFDTEIKV